MRKGKKKEKIIEKREQKKGESALGEKIFAIGFIRRWAGKQRATNEYVRMMEPRARPEEEVRRVWSLRFGIVAVLVAAAGLLAVICATEKPEEGFFLCFGRPLKKFNLRKIFQQKSSSG